MIEGHQAIDEASRGAGAVPERLYLNITGRALKDTSDQGVHLVEVHNGERTPFFENTGEPHDFLIKFAVER